MRKVKFNSSCTYKGTGYFQGFFGGPYGPEVVVEIIEGEGEQISKEEVLIQGHFLNKDGGVTHGPTKPGVIPKFEVRPFRKGQVVTCSASGIDFDDYDQPRPLPLIPDRNMKFGQT